jgi:hypothetical protein
MFRKINFRSTLIAAAIAGLLFSIPAYFFIRFGSYTGSWLLYMGSFLFLIVIWVNTLQENKKRGENESTIALVFNSHITTIAGILVACLLSFLLLAIFVPGYLSPGVADKVLTNEPATMGVGKTKGLSFEVFMAATIINFSVGSFSSIILPFYSKRNQTRDIRDPAPLHQKGAQ